MGKSPLMTHDLFLFSEELRDHMRPLVQSAVRASARATERKERKAAVAAASSSSFPYLPLSLLLKKPL